ncbi:hypothetical protein BJ508DRAFT_79298 [Ascobolus immersus RN42]|uniref:Uncharacterized protein n=1 Tax=Ascobolus immersus RN42 TaxID=1160509 RepID=A0A3N4HH49_ASCIM|nr:hypothetical protein BJ508DRAFT_79298 [Ascobolus immersus RN42]
MLRGEMVEKRGFSMFLLLLFCADLTIILFELTHPLAAEFLRGTHTNHCSFDTLSKRMRMQLLSPPYPEQKTTVISNDALSRWQPTDISDTNTPQFGIRKARNIPTHQMSTSHQSLISNAILPYIAFRELPASDAY